MVQRMPATGSMETSGLYDATFIGSVIVDGFTCYTIEVHSPDGSSWDIQRRYREIRELHNSLWPLYGDLLPEMPARRFFGNQDPDFIMERQVTLERYINGVLQLECRALSPPSRQFFCKAGQIDLPDTGTGYNCRSPPQGYIPGMQLLSEWLGHPAAPSAPSTGVASQAQSSGSSALVDVGAACAHTLVNTFNAVAGGSNMTFGVDIFVDQSNYASVAGNEAAASAREDFRDACVGAAPLPRQQQPPPPRIQDPFEAPATLSRIASYSGLQTSSRLASSCRVANARLLKILPSLRETVSKPESRS